MVCRRAAGLSCWPSAATWTSCAPGPTPATGLPPRRLAELLAERGDLDGAEQILRARADAGDWHAAERLADLLAERGDLDELRARADAGDEVCRRAAGRAAGRARRPGRAARPDRRRRRGMPPERLADLLTKQGRGEEAERLRRFGLNPDGSIACA